MPPSVQSRTAKLAFVREQLKAGLSGYAINKACRQKFGSGVSHYDIEEIRERLDARDQTEPVTPVVLPSEVLEPEPSGQAALPLVVNGTREHFRAIHSWMTREQVEQVILTKDGKLSVLAWHQIDIGGQDG